jgi:hypothetical protein
MEDIIDFKVHNNFKLEMVAKFLEFIMVAK